MTARESDVVRRAKELYERSLRVDLEGMYRDCFVSIEPESGDYFLGRTLEEAIGKARQAHPDRLTYTCRVGHPVAVEIGDRPPLPHGAGIMP